jgi:hypothetical protein
MLVRLAWIMPLLLAGMAAASAASPVAMPGRERDRFTTSPVERFMAPGPYVSAPVLTPPETKCAIPRRSKPRSKPVKTC